MTTDGEIKFLPNYHLKYFVLAFVIQKYEAYGRNQKQKKGNKKVSFKWAFKEFIWPRKKILFLGLLLIVIRSLSGLVAPMEIKELLDVVVPAGDIGSIIYDINYCKFSDFSSGHIFFCSYQTVKCRSTAFNFSFTSKGSKEIIDFTYKFF